eukprot:7685164-Alexandrium_andersonii.AAC.1
MHARVADSTLPAVSIVKYSADSWGMGSGNFLGKGRLRIDSGEAVCALQLNARARGTRTDAPPQSAQQSASLE